MIRHIVALKFKPGVSEARKQELYAELKALDRHIEGIVDFRSFRNVSIEAPVVRGSTTCSGSISATPRCAMPMLWTRSIRRSGPDRAETEGGPDGVYVFDVEL